MDSYPTDNTALERALPEALKDATRAHHARIEHHLPVFHIGFSRTDYIRLLEAFLGFYRPIEQQLAAVPQLMDWLPDFPDRLKTPLLLNDLEALERRTESIRQLPLCSDLPACENLATAAGCLYVLEGATLGGQVLSRHFKKTLSIDVTTGLGFFTGYGDNSFAMWQAYQVKLMDARLDRSQVIFAACATFSSLERWLRETFQTPLAC